MKLSIDYNKITPTSILKLMKQGLKVEFPSGYYLNGDISTKYIEVGHPFGSDGIWNMDLDGAKSAIQNAKSYEMQQLKEQQ